MYSLLTEEIKKFNLDLDKNSIKKTINNNNNNNNNNNKEIIENNKTIKKLFNENSINILNEERSLNTNFFNPLKNSPPNNWQVRLFNRINLLNDFNKV
tara:strand:+ start:1294 stop:1587 length:294 start_codon:yes stop_codon:yes gene_type:complete